MQSLAHRCWIYTAGWKEREEEKLLWAVRVWAQHWQNTIIWKPQILECNPPPLLNGSKGHCPLLTWAHHLPSVLTAGFHHSSPGFMALPISTSPIILFQPLNHALVGGQGEDTEKLKIYLFPQDLKWIYNCYHRPPKNQWFRTRFLFLLHPFHKMTGRKLSQSIIISKDSNKSSLHAQECQSHHLSRK